MKSLWAENAFFLFFLFFGRWCWCTHYIDKTFFIIINIITTTILKMLRYALFNFLNDILALSCLSSMNAAERNYKWALMTPDSKIWAVCILRSRLDGRKVRIYVLFVLYLWMSLECTWEQAGIKTYFGICSKIKPSHTYAKYHNIHSIMYVMRLHLRTLPALLTNKSHISI